MEYSTDLIKSEVCQWVLASKAVHGILLRLKNMLWKKEKHSNCWMLCLYDLISEWSCLYELPCIYEHAHMYTGIHMNVHLQLHVRIYVYMYTCESEYKYLYMCFYVKIYKLHIYKFHIYLILG